MREEKIRIIIMPDGSSTVEVLGVKGKRCLKMTEELEEEIGNVTERKAKAESCKFRLSSPIFPG